ncbi:MAG: ATP synthase F1 subunit delta [Candidatus Eisenbacteria bacterium]|nr:ATP synthase F1 subunit delta [Candidatus Eisenbacteria bacterium]
MQDAIVARKYATALFDAAVKAEAVESVAGDLAGIRLLGTQGVALGAFLEAPHITTEVKRGVLDRALKGRLSDLTLRFLHLLIDKKRTAQLDGISNRFDELVRDYRGIVAAKVRSAHPIDEAQLKRMADSLGRMIGKTVEIENKIEPEVIGGVVLEFGTWIVDRSIRRGLDDIRDQLMKAHVL